MFKKAMSKLSKLRSKGMPAPAASPAAPAAEGKTETPAAQDKVAAKKKQSRLAATAAAGTGQYKG